MPIITTPIQIKSIWWQSRLLLPFSNDKWELWSFPGNANQTLAGNGAPNPFETDGSNWYVRVNCNNDVYKFPNANQAVDFQKWLESFSLAACPVNSCTTVEVDFLASGPVYSLPTVVKPVVSGQGIVGVGTLNLGPGTHVVSTPIVIGNVIGYPNTAKKYVGNVVDNSFLGSNKECECGAAKTYQAKYGSSLHSSWCPAK